MKRINSIDIVRGIVMIIMALDHVRDLLHTTSITHSPTDLNTTSPALFFTRWITHLCAPVFVFLSGTSAFISFANKNNVKDSRRFLLKRGTWLIILEFTVVNFGVWFDIHFSIFLFDVIATIGFGFIILGLLLKLSSKTIGIIGISILVLHNLAPLIAFAENSIFKMVLMPLFAPGAFPIGAGKTFIMGYPLIPWLGIMLTGFGAGQFFLLEATKRKSLFLKIGLVSLILFVIIRFINIYGDSVPWTSQKNGFYTFLSFINVSKYPPSLVFCLLFLGIMFVILSMAEGMQNRFTRFTTVYGKVPLFYFLIHWYIIHPIVFVMVFAQGFKSSDLLFGFNFGRPKEGSGVELWAIFLIWIGVVIVLYPVCKWYGRYKEFHTEKKWLRYL